MTYDAPLPADLQQWVRDRMPGRARVTDVSWPRGDSMVWRLVTDRDEIYVKISPTPEDYAREVRGYAHAACALSPGEAPRLLAKAPGLRALMSSSQPGRVVRGLLLNTAEELLLYNLAGELLRRWHEHPVPASPHERAAIQESVAGQAREAATCLESITSAHLSTAERDLVRRVRDELPHLAKELPVVYRHGDYATRNWMWDASRGHGVIDFQKSAHGLAIEEFVWLFGAVWATRPDLEAAYFSGYGRPLTDTERQALLLFTTRLGVSYLHTGIAKRRTLLIDRGHLVLERMVRACS
ncbi:aminoglycoside phosphotransferase family protein [Streptomyces graminilatus]|uniref:aminoglycoside phosphotransferase family protein n=1 Tax=Streptomyces graminilatus TaxID=1464070 RepID=UPI0006E168BF|nr:aminoglycoside phosphotransferase family protein [Streptomyces graminilatus]